MKCLAFIFFTFGVIFCTYSQSHLSTQSHGARSHGLGGVRLNLYDSWALFNNIGALDRADHSGVSAGYDSRYGLKELQTVSLAANIKNNWGSLGLGLSRFGGRLFNQQILGLGFSNQIGIVSFGIKADWFQTQIEGFGTGNSLQLSFGGVAELGPKLFLATHISNVNRGKVSADSDQRLPTQVDMGINYVPTSQLNLFLELQKDLDNSARLKGALEYSLKKWITLRTGMVSNPANLFFGLQLKHGRVSGDYAFGQNTALGSTHHLSLSWAWEE